MRWKKATFIVTVSTVLLLTPVSLLSIPPVSGWVQKWDLSAKLKRIGDDTERMAEFHANILHALQRIDDKSALSRNLHQHLQSVQQAATAEGKLVSAIRDTTGEQASIGEEWNRLTRSLAGLMQTVSGQASMQSGMSHELNKAIKGTEKHLNEAMNANATLEQKLRQAAEKSEKAAASMP
ncbi:hypothetical protein [Staphylospora marina]|uniref:hypothetical protein n=1 Tax=Staphylospora marina TaxID=2490858 RepID=UPI000F5B8C7D|nr:hypothetical protein [Staphylospora marina]